MTTRAFETLKNQFVDYMISRCNLKESSTKAYINDLNNLSIILKNNGMVKNSIFEVKNLHRLMKIMLDVVDTDDFENLKNHGHSYGNTKSVMRHYYNFAASNVTFDAVSDSHIRVPGLFR